MDFLYVHDFVGMDFTLRVLEGMDSSVDFCRTLEAIMKGRTVTYFIQGILTLAFRNMMSVRCDLSHYKCLPKFLYSAKWLQFEIFEIHFPE